MLFCCAVWLQVEWFQRQDYATAIGSRTYIKAHSPQVPHSAPPPVLSGVAWGSGEPSMQRVSDSHTSCKCTGLWASAGSCPRLHQAQASMMPQVKEQLHPHPHIHTPWAAVLTLKITLFWEPHRYLTQLYAMCQKSLIQYNLHLKCHLSGWPPTGFSTYLETTISDSGGKIQTFPSKVLIKSVFSKL